MRNSLLNKEFKCLRKIKLLENKLTYAKINDDIFMSEYLDKMSDLITTEICPLYNVDFNDLISWSGIDMEIIHSAEIIKNRLFKYLDSYLDLYSDITSPGAKHTYESDITIVYPDGTKCIVKGESNANTKKDEYLDKFKNEDLQKLEENNFDTCGDIPF
jgi:hypothetical protein